MEINFTLSPRFGVRAPFSPSFHLTIDGLIDTQNRKDRKVPRNRRMGVRRGSPLFDSLNRGGHPFWMTEHQF